MKITFSALSLALIASGATAQQFTGAEIGINASVDSNTAISGFYSIDGSVEIGFGKFAVQLDASAFAYENSSFTQSSAVAHAIYAVSDQLALGAYVGIEDWNGAEGTNYVNTGVEALYAFANLPMTIETYWYNSQSVVGTRTFDYISLEATFNVSEKVGVFAGYGSMSTNLGPNSEYYNIGASYTMNNGMSISGEYVNRAIAGGGTGEGVNLRLSKSFGGGVTFGQRDWSYVTRGF